MKYLVYGVISLVLMTPTLFILMSSIIYPDNSYNTYAFIIAVIMFFLPLFIKIRG